MCLILPTIKSAVHLMCTLSVLTLILQMIGISPSTNPTMHHIVMKFISYSLTIKNHEMLPDATEESLM